MRISDWSSDVCSSDLPSVSQSYVMKCSDGKWIALHMSSPPKFWQGLAAAMEKPDLFDDERFATREARIAHQEDMIAVLRSEEHTSELQSLMRISYAVFCLKNKNKHNHIKQRTRK